MKNWQKIRKKLVNEKYPGKEELDELSKHYRKISEHIEEKYGVETFFAGSAGRATCMKGDRDIDLFLLFPEDLPRQKLENRGLNIGEKVFKHFDGEYQVEYAEHPYTKGEIEGFEVEIVPCYDTEPDQIKSAVDRSPHHAEWVRENLSQKQKQDVVLLKNFLKAGGLYGSSLRTRGFSGYLCEILIHEYGTFEDLVEQTQNWKEKQIIYPTGSYEELPGDLEKKFSEDSLIVIDPVDPERNVASVLTTENYAKFIHRCWQLHQKPGVNFFSKTRADVDNFAVQKELEKRGNIIVLEFESVDETEDIVYPQMRKAVRRLEKILEKNDFRIYESCFHVGEVTRIFFEVDASLPDVEYMKGPKVFHGVEHLDEFTSKYDNTFIRNDRIFAKTEREFTESRELLQEFLDGDSQDLSEKGIPSNVAEKISDFRMTDPMIEDDEWLKFLTEKLRIVP